MPYSGQRDAKACPEWRSARYGLSLGYQWYCPVMALQNSIEISFEGDHVLVQADGDKDYGYIERLWREVATACEQHDCFNVLGLAKTTTPIEAVDGYDLQSLYRQYGIDQRYRIAWVELNEDARSVLEFVETVLVNRGLPGRLFETEAEARAWLFDNVD